MPSLTGVQTCRSEEHTSELQSHSHLVCRLLLEKKTIIRKTGGLLPTYYSHRAASSRLADAVFFYPESRMAPRPRPSGRARDPASSFFFKETRTPEIDPLSLHDALPI